jgi:peptidoglycan hydrolase-like protein with peptidoglycan-binding domain
VIVVRLTRSLVVLALVAGFFAVRPAEPAAAVLPGCGGAYRFTGSVAPAGPVWIPVANHGWPDGRDCTLNLGAHNWGVYFLQVTLRNCYGQAIAADASFGAATRVAVQNAQRAHRIPDDGVYGPQTRRTIYWWTQTYSSGWGCNRFTW